MDHIENNTGSISERECIMRALKQIVIIVFVFTSLQGFTQGYKDLIGNTIDGKDISLRLPTVEELQISASENSPLLKLHDSEIVIKELQVRLLKRDWMNNFGFDAGVKYGLFDNLIITEDLGLDEVATSSTEQTRYSVGVFLRIPLSLIADKSNVKIAQVELEKTKYQREIIILELNKLIITQYANVLKAYRTLVIQNNSVETYRLQMLNAQNEFNNTEISIADLARFNDMLLKAMINLENIKIEYITAIQLLEETVGVDINLKE